MKLQWQQAPVKTQWGDEMVVASVAIDKDHTVDLYCERNQAPKVETMFAQRKPLTITEESAWDLARYVYARSNPHESPQILLSAMEIKQIIEAAHSITGEQN